MMEVQLPGGLVSENGRIERSARFHPLTGRLEQSLIESAGEQERPAYVTAVLSHAVASIGGLPADAATVSRLTVADRQYLMLRLGAILNGEQLWLSVDCAHCHSAFDVELRRCDLPVKEAGEGFPLAILHLNDREIEAGVPTGEDQQGIDDLADDEAMNLLLRKCIRSVNGKPPTEDFFGQLNEADVEAIDEALDEVSPAVCDQLEVTCPECHEAQLARLDHYGYVGLNEYFFYGEIHTLASHYHWSEADILDLPQDKRRRYLDLIGRAGGRTRG